jgi:hypothetical protein
LAAASFQATTSRVRAVSEPSSGGVPPRSQNASAEYALGGATFGVRQCSARLDTPRKLSKNTSRID